MTQPLLTKANLNERVVCSLAFMEGEKIFFLGCTRLSERLVKLSKAFDRVKSTHGVVLESLEYGC